MTRAEKMDSNTVPPEDTLVPWYHFVQHIIIPAYYQYHPLLVYFFLLLPFNSG